MDREELKKLRVVVLAGGWSDEKDISWLSGLNCQQALTEAGFKDVDILDIASENFYDDLRRGNYDVAFPALHGCYGEDGCIQGFLEILHMPYAFSGVLASSVSTEKEFAKAIYRKAGIRAPKGVDIPAGTQFSDAELAAMADEMGLPLFVKPSGNGSSFGISKVAQVDGLREAIEKAGCKGGRVLIEECITGTEITVPVVGNDDPVALPIIEVVFGAEFYDITVKYEPSELHHVIPARLDPDVYRTAQEKAVAAHKALGCLGASRSDFIVTAEGDPVILETNTIPGMTQNSLLPDSARHAGVEFPELCTRFVELALEAYEQRH